MKVDSNIVIERESLSLEKCEKNVWKLSIEGNVYYIHYGNGKFAITEEHNNTVQGYGGEETLSREILIEEFSDPYKLARYIIESIL